MGGGGGGGGGRVEVENSQWFFASKGPAHGERKMRGIMFVSSLDSRGDCAGRDNKFTFPFPLPPTGTIIISVTTDMG